MVSEDRVWDSQNDHKLKEKFEGRKVGGKGGRKTEKEEEREGSFPPNLDINSLQFLADPDM